MIISLEFGVSKNTEKSIKSRKSEKNNKKIKP
jgi:hypothetical protein